MLSFFGGIDCNVMGQSYCTTNGDAGLTVTPNLLVAKPHYFYFGHIWYTEISISKAALQAAIPGVNLDNITDIKTSARHSDFGGFGDVTTTTTPVNIYTHIKNSLDASGGPYWDTKKGDLRFWFTRMSASQGTLGKFFLVGVKVNGVYYWGKVLWKVVPTTGFTQNLTFSDRAIIGNGVNKAHLVHQTQSTECRNCGINPSTRVTPVVSRQSNNPNLVLKTPQDAPNHFLFSNFTNLSESISLKYDNCSGATNGVQIGNPSTQGTASAVSIQKQSGALSKVELDCQNTIIGSCNSNGTKRQVFLKLNGGSGIYEVNPNGQQVDISDPQLNTPELIDEYVLLRSDGLFGTPSIELAPGNNIIKVRDAQIYDIITGTGSPTNGEQIESTLRSVKNLLQQGDIQQGGYYTVNINVPACAVSTFQCNTPTIATNTTSLNFTSSASNQALTVTGSNLTGTWSAATTNSWITFNPASPTGGNGATSFTINVSANTASTSRSGSVTISGGGATSITINVSQSGVSTSSCYRLNVANFASGNDFRPITLNNNILNLNSAGDNTNNSIWKVVPDNGYSKIVSVTNENTAITIEGGSAAFNNIVNVASYTGASSQKWLINQDAYGNNYLRSSLNTSLFIGGGNGAYGGGDSDPNTKDLKLKNDASWGANKWVMQSVTCPISCILSSPTSVTANPSTISVSGTSQLSGTCTSGTIKWYNTSTGGTALASSSPWTTPTLTSISTYYAACNNGTCESSRVAVMVTVMPPNGCNAQTSITSNGLYQMNIKDESGFIGKEVSGKYKQGSANTTTFKITLVETVNETINNVSTPVNYYKIVNNNGNTGIEVTNNGDPYAAGSFFIQGGDGSADNQKFKFVNNGNGFVKVIPKHIASWGWGVQMETYSGSGEYGLIRQYGFDNPVSSTQLFRMCYVGAGARVASNEVINETDQKQGIYIAPNPVNNMLHYSYISDADTDEINLQVFDMTGRNLKTLKQPKTGRITKGNISVENLPEGSYILNANDSVKQDSKRFIKE